MTSEAANYVDKFLGKPYCCGHNKVSVLTQHMPHVMHLNGFPLGCVFTCRLKFDNSSKLLLQTAQLYGGLPSSCSVVSLAYRETENNNNNKS